MIKAVCPGSYNPITNGHVDFILRASKLFDEITVLIMVNSEKKYDFSMEERMKMAREVFSEYPNIIIDCWDGLLSDYTKDNGISVVVKGVRNTKDYEYEAEMAEINTKLNPDLDTVFIPSDHEHTFISSSMVKEVARHGGDIKCFVPKEICDIITDRLMNE